MKLLHAAVIALCILSAGEVVAAQKAPVQTDAIVPALVNINSASEKELQMLPGIGAAKAKAIVQYRDQNGPFTSVEQLVNVAGVGDKLLAKIKDKVSI
ncbi:ComEA family DNA-binding protein [Pseudoalteromonas sp. SSDWG2]|uniref:ComEA family DNA-binding protein n=1 Tax=Pseudoalteromonas sp. SSDWG2 TaxID=3139391 RepID=UPI003BABAE07